MKNDVYKVHQFQKTNASFVAMRCLSKDMRLFFLFLPERKKQEAMRRRKQKNLQNSLEKKK